MFSKFCLIGVGKVVESVLECTSCNAYIVHGLVGVCSCYFCVINYTFGEAFTEEWACTFNAAITCFQVG